jgi:hypothetical protein
VRVREEDVPIISAEHVVDPSEDGVLLVICPGEATARQPDIL